MKIRSSDTARRWTVKIYPPRSTMNPALHQRYVGPDIHGNTVSGMIWHVGNYDKDGNPTVYIVQLDQNGHKGATAKVSASAVHKHLQGLALCDSMEADNG